MPYDLIQINTRKRPTRIAFVLAIAVASAWSVYAFRWYIGNTMAEYFNTSQNDLELAQVARTLSPKDPLTHWRLGQVSQKVLPLEQSAAALTEYEKAVALSPNDYRLWMTLGIACGQAGELEKAEPALRQAVALAPYYAYPHWYLGNLLVRSGRYEEAFAELQKASDADPEEFRSQLFNLVFAVYGADITSAVQAVGPRAETRANFASYLMSQQKYEDGLAVWNALSAEEKKANEAVAESIITSLTNNRRYHNAMVLWNDIIPASRFKVEEGKILDGGFEEPVNYGPSGSFGWQIKNNPQMQIKADPEVSHSGTRSLRILFQVRSKAEQIGVSQLVPVAKDATYDFECFVKTSELQSGGPPFVQIIDGANGSQLTASQTASSGTNDWTRIALTFKTSNSTEAVTVSIVRASCGEEVQVCPIFGSVWYDDFSFKRHN
jgi:Carbohydrate binding domain/Tetratricopeptide repeat